MKHVLDILGMVESTVQDTARSEMVVGRPLELGGLTIVPLSRVSLGFGAGGGRARMTGEAEDSVGGGAGGGARVRPVAVAVFGPDGVSVHPIPDRKGKLEKLIDLIPDLAEKVRAAVGEKEEAAD